MHLVTRAQLGWPVSAAPMQATTRGVKVHYEGTDISPRLLTDHALCLALWKAIRSAHLANEEEGYSDIAYNYGACVHGYLLEGRGLGRRTGANGNQTLNQAHYAICGLLGSEGLTEPTPEMLGAIRDGIDLLRQHGAGTEIKGHRDGYATSCPGAPLYAWVQKGAPRPATTPEEDMPLTADEWTKLRGIVHDELADLLTTRYPSVADPDKTLYLRDHLRGAGVAAVVRASAQQSTTAVVQALTPLIGSEVDTAVVVAALRDAIATSVVHVDVDVTGTTEGN